MSGARELSVTRLHSGRIVTLDMVEVALPNGATTRLEIVHHPGASAVVPLHPNQDVTLVHQYRHAAGGFLYEIPAGLLHPGEDSADCARRELAEETGLSANGLEPLTAYHTTPGFSDEVIHLFLATELTDGEQNLDHDEVLQVVRMPLDDALAGIRSGAITDGKTIVALLLTAERLREQSRTTTGGGKYGKYGKQ
ncbi:MAG: NUDIX hydrolase [Nitrospirota bacterium]|nr:NUDIX hydrolase [Nitrospirota bacterium]